MKRSITSALLCAISMTLVSCNEDGQTTTVSKSLWSKDTIVSSSNSNGSFTRTQYGSDFWGNPETVVTRGHANATQQDDVAKMVLKLVVGAVAESSK